ncbi:hypothetical protein [Brevibacillus nitrificans]|uniref:hypothetical protein n=1 Tax=Brevibacillus nitrificans TaxID=651560 RepID=UPI0028636281|nr:hypothetical protein [Brevibacillus nitrificans]MDR7319584.1 hypothetical protein [Brevibacillus nitrificans]
MLRITQEMMKSAEVRGKIANLTRGYSGLGLEVVHFICSSMLLASWPYPRCATAEGMSCSSPPTIWGIFNSQHSSGHGVRAFSVHPGSIVTNLSRFLSDEEMRAMGALDEQGRRAYTETTDERKTVPEGAATIVLCAVSQQLEGMGGVYCQNADIAPLLENHQLDDPRATGVWPWAANEEDADRLWALSEELTGMPFDV